MYTKYILALVGVPYLDCLLRKSTIYYSEFSNHTKRTVLMVRACVQLFFLPIACVAHTYTVMLLCSLVVNNFGFFFVFAHKIDIRKRQKSQYKHTAVFTSESNAFSLVFVCLREVFFFFLPWIRAEISYLEFIANHCIGAIKHFIH